MRYTVLSDIHANYPALEAVLRDTPEVDNIISLGDMVGLMGFPEETIRKLKQKAKYAIKGNHDIAVVEKKTGHINDEDLSSFELRTTSNALTQVQEDWVKSLHSYKEIGGNILMAHAQPYASKATGLESGNKGIKKKQYTRVASRVDSQFDFVLLGHTHEQSALNCEAYGHDVIVLNPGSVGQRINDTAHYALIDTNTKNYELRKVEYKEEKVVDRLTDLNVPFKWWL